MHVAVIVVAVVLALSFVVAGQSTVISGVPEPIGVTDADRNLVTSYFDQLNAAAGKGVQAEQEFLVKTQVPEFSNRLCGLNGLTILEQPTLSTLRPDPAWIPSGAGRPPAGSVYVVAVTLVIKRGSSVLGNQIGSQRIVVAKGSAFGFTPCASQ